MGRKASPNRDNTQNGADVFTQTNLIYYDKNKHVFVGDTFIWTPQISLPKTMNVFSTDRLSTN